MKYLKLFNESYSSDDYYEEVSLSDYEKWSKVRIPQSLVRKIESRLIWGYGCRRMSPTYLKIWGDKAIIKNMMVTQKDYTTLNFKTSYMIRMSGDEWYWVDVDNSLAKRKYVDSHVYYRCDQEEGLMRLLSDFGLVK